MYFNFVYIFMYTRPELPGAVILLKCYEMELNLKSEGNSVGDLRPTNDFEKKHFLYVSLLKSHSIHLLIQRFVVSLSSTKFIVTNKKINSFKEHFVNFSLFPSAFPLKAFCCTRCSWSHKSTQSR